MTTPLRWGPDPDQTDENPLEITEAERERMFRTMARAERAQRDYERAQRGSGPGRADVAGFPALNRRRR